MRALQEILISKARMRLDHQGLPHHPVDRMIHLAIHHGTHTGHLSAKHLKKIIKRMEKRVARIATKVTKKTQIKAEAKGINATVAKKAAIISG